ncbi:hypothetical protein MRB53_039343 [Persea americana]|nr:hypothetical protein MRB53_039343 [Persea americana]
MTPETKMKPATHLPRSLPQTPNWLDTSISTAPSSALSQSTRLWDFGDSLLSDDGESIASSCDDVLGPELDIEALDIGSPVKHDREKLDLMQEIAQGSHATVYRARYRGMTVAAKVASSRATIEYLRREKQVLECLHERLSVKHIINYYPSSSPILLMELADCDLMQYIYGVDPRDRHDVWRQHSPSIVSAIESIHSIGMIHGDIKPRNILMVRGVLKLCDFETAFTLDNALPRPLEKTSDVVGTNAFQAPELLSPLSVPTLASDVWALGMTLLVLATAEEPYSRARSNVERIMQIQRGDPLRFIEATLPPDIESFVRICCTRDLSKRPTAAKLAAKF